MARAFIRPLFLSVAALIAACGTGQNDLGAAPAVATPLGQVRALADGWFEAHPEPGVFVRFPKGWKVNRGEGGVGPIQFTGPNGARVVVWPTFVDRRERMPAQFAILRGFARSAAPDFTWGTPAPFGANGERMFGRSQDAVAQATFSYANTPAGLAGYWYLTAARTGEYESLQPLFVAMMRGVRIIGEAGAQRPQAAAASAAGAPAAAPAPLRFVAWREPNEGAYTTQVPAGWRVNGGVVRPDPMRLLDPVEIQSPDGQVYVFSGDRTLPVFKTPTRLEQSMGMTEGMNNGNGVLMRYRPAAQFLPDYLSRRFSARCGSFQVVDVLDQPDLAAIGSRQLAASGAGQNLRVDVATAQFRCGSSVGLVQLATFMIVLDGTASGVESFGLWQVSGVGGFIAPEARAAEGGQAVVAFLTRREINPQWARANQQMVAAISNINQQSSQQISDIIRQRFRSTSGDSTTTAQIGSSDDLIRRRENAMLDQTDVIDDRTGERYKVASGSNYYWIDQQGSIIGTNAPSQPTIDFQEMTQLP